jgi:hypothetical protein
MSKSETSPNDKNTKSQTFEASEFPKGFADTLFKMFEVFDNSNFEFVSYFVLRYLDLKV